MSHKVLGDSAETERKRQQEEDDNTLDIGLSTDGHLTVGVGGGLSIDSGGHLGIEIIPGFSIPLGSD